MPSDRSLAAGTAASPGAAAVRTPRLPRVSDVRGVAALRRWQAAHPRRVDAVLAAVVFAAVVWGPLADGDDPHDRGGSGDLGRDLGGLHGHAVGPDALTVLLVGVGAAALTLRRTHPLQVWLFSLLVSVGVIAHTGEPPAAVLLLVTLYTVGTRLPLRTTVFTALATAVVFLVSVAARDGLLSDRDLTLLAVVGAAAAVGVAVRSQRAAVEAAEARARQAEATREEEAERRVTDERLRIARELHDVVAHHISVINVQAGVARHLLDAQPEQARSALTTIREASRTVLAEMSTVLGLLRTGEDEVPTAPAPGLDQVGALVDSLRGAGLRVTATGTGDPRPLPQLADLAAYRVVQESLTNALKHGDGAAELRLQHRPDAVSIEVRNRPGPGGPAAAGGGHGLLGMRERVTAVGGRFAAGPDPDGVFTVRVTVPRDAP